MRLDMPAVKATEIAQLAAPTEGDEIVGDYASLGLTLRRHPLVLLRDKLKNSASTRRPKCRKAATAVHQRRGLVTCRQRSATASGGSS
jgi:error-prone DNA polymerase